MEGVKKEVWERVSANVRDLTTEVCQTEPALIPTRAYFISYPPQPPAGT